MSGGPDSLALMLLAHAALPGQFEVATVDHGLRTESAQEARDVAAVCADLGISHATLTVTVAAEGNLQANARSARYEAMANWLQDRQLGVLATAHHADDQAETLLMRLNRGAGVRGLAGMRSSGPVPGDADWPLLRPLLGWRRADLAKIVAAAGLVAADDPSNANARFERVRVRQGLGAADWLDPVALAAAAARLADADEALAWSAENEWNQAVVLHDDSLDYAPAAPRAIRLHVLERVVAMFGTSTPRGAELARWHDALEGGRIATLAGVKATPRGNRWTFAPVPPHRT